MTAFIWNANPAKWHVVPPAHDSWEALRAYVVDESRYVYWATPALKGVIRPGDKAYLWRTHYKSEPSGIIATGVVAERPNDLQFPTRPFDLPERLEASGWNEAAATSSWKTGIKITDVFWTDPVIVPIKPSQGTVRTLSDEEIREIEKALSCPT